MRIAIMQPYLWSQMGYYRLFACTDLFVILDDVQHIKGGWVNRNRLTLKKGGEETDGKGWFTLPIKDTGLKTKIKDLQWAEDAQEKVDKAMRRFTVLEGKEMKLREDVCSHIIDNMMIDCYLLGIPFCAVRASAIGYAEDLRGQDRVLAICSYFRAREYVNVPGGAELYEEEAFRRIGVKLRFLPEYKNMTSVVERLTWEDPKELKKEIYATCY